MPTDTIAVTDYEANWAAHARCGHQEYAGYYVIQTVGDDGTVLAEPVVVDHVVGGGQYARALEIARTARADRGWAVIGSEYACGHVLR